MSFDGSLNRHVCTELLSRRARFFSRWRCPGAFRLWSINAVQAQGMVRRRGPKYVVKRGKTPVLSADQARQLLDSIDVTELSGLRDRALIGVMVYSFARVSAAATLRVEDYFEHGKRAWLRLHEKGGKRHEVPCHHNLAAYLDAWIDAAGIAVDKKGPLFRAIRKETSLPKTRWRQRMFST
jgi:integrase